MPKIATTGAGGVLGLGLAEALESSAWEGATFTLGGRNHPPFWKWDWEAMDLLRPGEARAWLLRHNPQFLLHAAAMTRLDTCEKHAEACQRINLEATQELCAAASELRTSILFVSTDQVFDGKAEKYAEDANCSPVHAYGRAKAAAERLVLEAGGVVARLPLLLGGEAGPQRMGADTALHQAMLAGEELRLFEDEFRAPLPAVSAAEGLLKLLQAMQSASPPQGVFHFGGEEVLSRLELGKRIQEAAKLSASIVPASASSWGGPQRPLRLVLSCERAKKELFWKAPNLRQYLSANASS